MTIILLTAISTLIISFFLHKYIRRYNIYIYVVTFIISLIALNLEANLITLGYIPLGIFLVVMFSGAMDKGEIRKRMFMVRAELSIIASILLFPHSWGYLEYYLDELGLSSMTASFFLGLFAFIIVIPLFVTSFKIIRRKLSYKQWKKLHKLAYLFYLFIGLHLILLNNDRMILYIVLFSTYFGIKFYNFLQKKQLFKKAIASKN